ncbi:MAG TPA: alkaline phosphatase family protein [Thermoanaerobaculia bacterium]|nr:alkaline phosphatase family protein [Thermoanaerobaculia bacterium]
MSDAAGRGDGEADPKPARRLRPPRPAWLDVLAAGLAPGALLGTHLAGLIFFLNPGLPFSPGPVLRGVLVYGSLLGLVGLLLHLPFTWRSPRRARRGLPWGLTAALAAAALLDWTHAAFYAYYLPPGINERLIKTALWLSLGALIAFYTALLHTLHRRRYGVRSRSLLTLVTFLSVYAMVERREAFQPRLRPAPRPTAVEAGQRPRLLLVGIDTATLDALLPLASQGRLPFLAAVLRGGAYGRLESISPPRREALWTTLATGKLPYKHGVIGGRIYPASWIARGAELRLLPVGIAFRSWGTLGGEGYRVSTYPREVLTLWEILPRLGIPSGMVGWPASAPVPEETAFALSERFFTGAPEPRSARPEDAAARTRLYRPGPREMREPLGAGAPPVLLEAAVADLWRRSSFSVLHEQNPEVEAAFLVLPGLREVSRRFFGGFDAVQFAGDQSPEARQAAERIATYYALLDGWIAEVWNRESGPRLLAVVSPSGVEPQGRWERLQEGMTLRASLEGSLAAASDGILLLYGDGIRPGALLTEARLVDVAPTLLYGLGFPVAQDFDGKAITEAFEKSFLARHPLTFLPSYEGLEGAGR